jgi:ABC-2 type transport system ATP-binding protein
LVVKSVRPAKGQLNHAVHTENITCRFGDFVAVDRVNLAIESGEIFGLLGPNGAGKTTLIKMLCGLQKTSAGQGLVGGFDVEKQRMALREHIGYMSQRFSLYRDLTVTANLDLYAGLYGLPKTARRQRIDGLLTSLGLGDYAGRLTDSLPMGLRQRLGLACALLHEPPVLFLDEPTSGVDPIARRQFWDIVHLLAEQSGVTVLVSTHYMDEAEHCHRLGLMQAGKLITVGTPAELKRQAQERSGPVIAVDAKNFEQTFPLLHGHFPKAMLYGRRIQWQSLNAGREKSEAEALLQQAGLAGDIAIQGLSMEETFASFLEAGGAANV